MGIGGKGSSLIDIVVFFTSSSIEQRFIRIGSSTYVFIVTFLEEKTLLQGGHQRVGSGGGRFHEHTLAQSLNTADRIAREIHQLDQRLEQKLRERRQIGKLFLSLTNTTGVNIDPLSTLKTRNIDFPWRRGTRIGHGGIGVAFRAINCSTGSIVCMKEIALSRISSRSLEKNYLEDLRQIAEEIDMIMTIEHPNIVRYFGIERYRVRRSAMIIRSIFCSF